MKYIVAFDQVSYELFVFFLLLFKQTGCWSKSFPYEFDKDRIQWEMFIQRLEIAGIDNEWVNEWMFIQRRIYAAPDNFVAL